MDLIAEAKAGHKVYRYTFPDGTRVPFRLLSWGDFNLYYRLYQKGTIAEDILENQIFKECVVDSGILEQMHDMKAGLVSTIAGIIMVLSGPADLDKFDGQLEIARQTVDTINSQIVMIICRAFPAYTPEDIEQMSWETTMQRLAQAERILMSKQPPELAEPLKLTPLKDGQKAGKVNPADLVAEDGKQMQKHLDRPQRPMSASRAMEQGNLDDLSPEQKQQLKAMRRAKTMRSTRRR